MSNGKYEYENEEPTIHVLKEEQLHARSGSQIKWGVFAAFGALAVWAAMQVYGVASPDGRELYLDNYLPNADVLAYELNLERLSLAADVFETLDDTADRYTNDDDALAMYLSQAKMEEKTDRSIQVYDTAGQGCRWADNPVMAVETISQRFESEEAAQRYFYNERLDSNVTDMGEGVLLYHYNYSNIASRFDYHLENLGADTIFKQCANQPDFVDFISADKVVGNVLYFTRIVVALDEEMPTEAITESYEAELVDLMKSWDGYTE